MTIVETTCSVTAGVDTHADVHVAAVVDHVGGVLGVETFATTAAGLSSSWSSGCARTARSTWSASRAPARTGPG